MTQNNTTKTHGVDFVDLFQLYATVESLIGRVGELEAVVEILQEQEKKSAKK